jgi:hypothetical protein
MPKLFFVRGEHGERGDYVPTLREAQAEFQSMIDDGIEPYGVGSVFYRNNRASIAKLVNDARSEALSAAPGEAGE